MDKIYYDTVRRLEEMGIDREYVQGWMGGWLGNPRREEQRVTEGYSVGYEDGRNRHTDNAGKFRR